MYDRHPALDRLIQTITDAKNLLRQRDLVSDAQILDELARVLSDHEMRRDKVT